MDFKERYQLEIKTIGNKNYISIVVSVRARNFVTRNSGYSEYYGTIGKLILLRSRALKEGA